MRCQPSFYVKVFALFYIYLYLTKTKRFISYPYIILRLLKIHKGSYYMERTDIEVKRLLEKILSILKLANSKAILQEKEEILKNKTKRKIYELCDRKHTVNDIASELKTTQPNVSYHLSSLLESGLVLYDELGGKRYYFKSLE
jgi:DNA-binding transcriptional ArsR family regulator